MERTVFIFHGTEGYPEENWFPWMKGELEKEGCMVIVPQFPSPPIVPAKIDDWFAVLREYEAHMDEETILIGHSLGGVFALRLLERLRHPVRASVFVGTPVGVRPIANFDRDVSFSGFTFDWDTIRKNAGEAAVYQSDDDPYVGLHNGKELAQKLNAELSFIPHAGHFNTASGYTTFESLQSRVCAMAEKQ